MFIDPRYSYFFAAAAGVFVYQAILTLAKYRKEAQPSTLWFAAFTLFSSVHTIFFIPIANKDHEIIRMFAGWHTAFGISLFGIYILCLKNFFMNDSKLLKTIATSMFVLSAIGFILCGLDFMFSEYQLGLSFANNSRDGSSGLGTAIKIPFGISRIVTIFALLYIVAKGRTSRDRIIQAGIFLSIFSFLHSAITGMLFPDYFLPLVPFMNLIEVARFGWLTLKKDSLVLESYKGRIGHLETSLTSHVRLSKMGEKTASIIHDMSNPLMIIYGIVYKLEKIAIKKSDPELAETVEKLERACESATHLIQSGREAYHPSGKQIGNSRIAEVLEMTQDLMSTRCEQEHVTYTVDNTYDYTVFGEIGDLTRVLVNIVNNACDAMSDLEPTDKWIKISSHLSNGNFLLAVENGGPKIPPDIAENIFNPFFSTKIQSGGTGLGLHVCRNLLANLGASLDLDTNSENTCFVLSFPIPEAQKKAG